MAFRVQIRRDPSGKWIVNNPVLLSGEFGYETDTSYMKIGDGVTPWNYLPYWTGAEGATGATGAGLEGSQYILVTADGSDIENAEQLQAAYDKAKTMSPTGDNRISVIVSPGNYNFGDDNFLVDTDYIDILPIVDKVDDVYNYYYGNVIFNSESEIGGTIVVSALDVRVKGINVLEKSFRLSDGLGSSVIIQDCSGDGEYSFGGDEIGISIGCTFINCIGEFSRNGYSFGNYKNCNGFFHNAAGYFYDCRVTSFNLTGIFENCNITCFGYQDPLANPEVTGSFDNCEVNIQNDLISGYFINCKGLFTSRYGSNTNLTGVFTDCFGDFGKIGDLSSLVGLPGELSGLFTRCRGIFSGDNNSSTVINNNLSGIFIDCIGSFGSYNIYYYSTTFIPEFSGVFINCYSDSSFSFGIRSTGFFHNCTAGTSSFGVGSSNNRGSFGYYVNCTAGDNSFGGTRGTEYGISSGNYINCVAGERSFGGAYSVAASCTGIYEKCIAGSSSFGGINSQSIVGGSGVGLTGKLYYCRLTDLTFRTVTGGGRTIYCIDGDDNANNQ